MLHGKCAREWRLKSVGSFFTGSPAIHGEKVEDSDVEDVVSDVNEPLGSSILKEKPQERMLGWHMNHGQSGELGPPTYDKEAPISHIPRLATGRTVFRLLYFLNICVPPLVNKLNYYADELLFSYYCLGFWRPVSCISWTFFNAIPWCQHWR